ncbi:AAA family ATPase [Vibrio fluvialis]|uniref:AAA family ATPase n=1 Tax=Vibrio fluvialis TaxID=676 RepID=UPI001EEA3CA9|nr:ATP-binding protein [Vibrio fluvialis]
MLLKYGLRNFFGFREGAEVSFELPASVCSEYPNKDDVSYLLGVKGKNGAGKTNLLKALSFMGDFATSSFSDEPEDTIDIDSYYSNNEPSAFYVEYKMYDVIYRYELECTEQRVLRETLFRKEKRLTKIIERFDNSFETLISELDSVRVVKLRNNASFISTIKHYDLLNIDALAHSYSFFNSILSNVHMFGMQTNQPDLSKVSQIYDSNEKYLEFAKNVISNCDTGVDDIKIVQYSTREGVTEYAPLFERKINDKIEALTYFVESSGTKSLYLQLGKYKYILDIGGILVLDEFDINLHPHILPILLNLFTNEETNPKNSQLIFTTHDTEVLDLLGKYRTYFVDKVDNECYSYRLDEIPSDILRKGRSMVPAYNAGKIGGIPRV